MKIMMNTKTIQEKLEEIQEELMKQNVVDNRTVAMYTLIAIMKKLLEAKSVKVESYDELELRRTGISRVIEIDRKYIIAERK